VHPFIHIGPFQFGSYGLLIIVGVFCGALALRFQARRKQFPVEDALYAYLYGIFGLAIGAKLLYLIQALPYFIADWDSLVFDLSFFADLLTTGFVFYGGLIGGIAGAFIYAKQYRFKFLYLIELIIPALPIAHAFGRIGCFMAGCCYGIHYDGPISICFPSTSFGPVGTPLFPVQLLESALLFMLAAFLLLYDKRAKAPRNIIGCYLFLYGIIRMFTEMFRGDELRGSFLFFSTSQWISVFIILAGVVLLLRFKSVTVPGAEFRTSPVTGNAVVDSDLTCPGDMESADDNAECPGDTESADDNAECPGEAECPGDVVDEDIDSSSSPSESKHL